MIPNFKQQWENIETKIKRKSQLFKFDIAEYPYECRPPRYELALAVNQFLLKEGDKCYLKGRWRDNQFEVEFIGRSRSCLIKRCYPIPYGSLCFLFFVLGCLFYYQEPFRLFKFKVDFSKTITT